MPGSASAAESRVRDDFCAEGGRSSDCGRKVVSDPTLVSSVAATSTSADAVAAAGTSLAGVDVLRRFGIEGIGIELHLALRKLAFFPRLRRAYRRAARHDQHRENAQRRLAILDD